METHHSEHLSVDGRIILEWILEKECAVDAAGSG
jgi:hypothetical protein